jgi:hypothetical protein
MAGKERLAAPQKNALLEGWQLANWAYDCR